MAAVRKSHLGTSPLQSLSWELPSPWVFLGLVLSDRNQNIYIKSQKTRLSLLMFHRFSKLKNWTPTVHQNQTAAKLLCSLYTLWLHLEGKKKKKKKVTFIDERISRSKTIWASASTSQGGQSTSHANMFFEVTQWRATEKMKFQKWLSGKNKKKLAAQYLQSPCRNNSHKLS